jgi:hypothetical protein
MIPVLWWWDQESTTKVFVFLLVQNWKIGMVGVKATSFRRTETNRDLHSRQLDIPVVGIIGPTDSMDSTGTLPEVLESRVALVDKVVKLSGRAVVMET